MQGDQVQLSIRPEKLELTHQGAGQLNGRVRTRLFLGITGYTKWIVVSASY
ncbi:TOBE domain-containing protein [Halomonas sp. PA16-9]|uniref:TOBE domain-containing protein n=1 Tax=Halomonas sp. PA16-9 TaxID=2576841 RepID=UPI003FA5C0F1